MLSVILFYTMAYIRASIHYGTRLKSVFFCFDILLHILVIYTHFFLSHPICDEGSLHGGASTSSSSVLCVLTAIYGCQHKPKFSQKKKTFEQLKSCTLLFQLFRLQISRAVVDALQSPSIHILNYNIYTVINNLLH